MFFDPSGFLKLFGLATAFCAAVACSPSAKAAEMVLNAISAETGVQGSLGFCPCLRWTVGVMTAGGEVRTDTFILSSDALLEFEEHPVAFQDRTASRFLKLGTAELLLRGRPVGLVFEGVELGHDSDRGYSEVLRTGLGVVLSMIHRPSWNLEGRFGYHHERLRLNLAPAHDHAFYRESLVFRWHGDRWSAKALVNIDMPADRVFPFESNRDWGVSAEATGRVRVLRWKDIEAGLNVKLAADHDAIRGDERFAADSVSGTIFMDFAWVPLKEEQR